MFLKSPFLKVGSFVPLLVLSILLLTADTAAQPRPYRVTDKQLGTLLRRIESSTDRFRSLVDRDLDESRVNGTRFEDGFLSYIDAFESATDRLDANFKQRRSTLADVREVLVRADVINGFVNRNLLSPATRNQWAGLRRNLETLAGYYRTTWEFRDPAYAQPGFYNLTGTYRLDRSRSDDTDLVIDRLLVRLGVVVSERNRYRENLRARLTAPDVYVIQQDGKQFTIGSSLSQRLSFDADGVSRNEKSPSGVNARLTASHSDLNGLSLVFAGDRSYDYHSNFVRQGDGMLRVIRKISLPDRPETVSVAWVYDRIAESPNWSYSQGRNGIWVDGGQSIAVVEGTKLVGTLCNRISTKASRAGDTFTLEVVEPEAYRDYLILGRITDLEHSGRVSGTAKIGFAFEQIQDRSGRRFPFSGSVSEVLTPNGKRIQGSNGDVLARDSQTKSTVVRAGVGAAIGAVIGAISGGKKGAAIGAIVGAGVGVGSVLLEGRDEIDLPYGTRFTLVSQVPYAP